MLDLEAMEDAEDAGLDLNLVMSAARMHRLRHNAGGPQVRLPSTPSIQVIFGLSITLQIIVGDRQGVWV